MVLAFHFVFIQVELLNVRNLYLAFINTILYAGYSEILLCSSDTKNV